jgi:hypothetical protein
MMSQLADIEEVVSLQPLSDDDQAKLFYDLLGALRWDIEGVSSWQDAKVYLEMRHG